MAEPLARGMGFSDMDSAEVRITEAVFAQMETTDIPKIRVSDVLKEAAVSRSTFYRRFTSVDDVVKRFEDALLESMRAINDIAIKARFTTAELNATATMIRRMEVLLAHRDQIVALNGPHGDPAFTHKATVFMHDHLSARLSDVLGPSTDLELYLAFMLAGHNNLVQFWLEKCPEVPPTKVAHALNRMFYAPFFLRHNETDLPHHINLD